MKLEEGIADCDGKRINKDEGDDKRKALIAMGATCYTPFHIACMDEMLDTCSDTFWV